MTIDKRLKNYTCFCKTFAIFVNEKEINLKKSSMLKAFTSINSIKSFLQMGLPIKKWTRPKSEGTDFYLKDISNENKNENIAFEIDLQQLKKIRKNLNLGRYNLDCYPLVWCY